MQWSVCCCWCWPWRCIEGQVLALAADFEEENGGCGGDIERIGLPMHGDAHLQIGLLHPGWAETILFGADDNGYGTGTIDGRVAGFGVWGRSEASNSVLAQPCDGFLAGGLDDRAAEDRADTGADDIRVVDVGAAVADDHGVGTCGVGATQDCAKIPGFFDGFGNHQKGAGGERDIGQLVM